MPTLKEYPNAVIITTDDDVYYKPDWLRGLVDAYNVNPKYIYCYRASKIMISNEFCRLEPKKDIQYQTATYLHQQTGVGGVLYPPGSLNGDTTDEELFMKLAPTNDDLWLWFMGIRNGYKISILQNNDFELFYIGDSQRYSLSSINNKKDMLYFKQLEKLIDHYPDVFEALKEEQTRMMKIDL